VAPARNRHLSKASNEFLAPVPKLEFQQVELFSGRKNAAKRTIACEAS